MKFNQTYSILFVFFLTVIFFGFVYLFFYVCIYFSKELFSYLSTNFKRFSFFSRHKNNIWPTTFKTDNEVNADTFIQLLLLLLSHISFCFNIFSFSFEILQKFVAFFTIPFDLILSKVFFFLFLRLQFFKD